MNAQTKNQFTYHFKQHGTQYIVCSVHDLSSSGSCCKVRFNCSWRMVRGAWRMVHGAWRMAHGAWRMAHGARHCSI
jgi:hypothetical protein